MKKKETCIMIGLSLFLLVFAIFGMKGEAAAKTTTKAKVQKAISSIKSGKYVYFTDGKAIYREKIGVSSRSKKLSKYPADGGFMLNGKYIYYHSKDKNTMYRMTKTGKSHKTYKVSAARIRAIKGGYIYYNNSMGLNRIKTSGSASSKKKVISYPNNYNSFIIGNRVYYSRTKITDNKDGSQTFKSYIESVDLNGKNKKTHKVFKDARDITLVGEGRYLYSSVALKKGYEIGIIDTKAKKPEYKKLKFYEVVIDELEYFDELDRYAPIAVFNGILYFQNEEYLYSMNNQGEERQIMKMPTENVQGVKIEKHGEYYRLVFHGDDDFGSNFIYNENWEQVKKLTRKYGNVEKLGIKGKKLYVIFNKSEDMDASDKVRKYLIYNLK